MTQKGGSGNSGDWRVRSFSYDDLSRLTQENTPEGGIVTYSYSGNCSGSPAQICSRTDARGATTTYAYDALYRPTSRTYSDGTPTVTYFYDQASYNGLTITNGKGRRTGMSDGTGSTAWSYDSMGRVLTRKQTISSVSRSTIHSYNLDGSVSSITYPSGRTVNYAYNSAAQPISATDAGSGTKYVSNAHYNAAGQLTSMYDGETVGWISITRTNTYNNRLQVTRLQASSPLPLNLLDLSYSYDQGSGKNNGSVVQITNNRDTTRSIAFTYDQLNRILTAQTPNSSLWGDSFVIDPWGNLLQKNVIKGTAETLNVTANSKNQISTGGYTYDLSGNLLTDTFHTLLFNAENQATPQSGTVYSYDGDGRRVIKSGNNYYWDDDDFSPLTLTDTSGNAQRDFIFFDGQRVGMYVFSNGNPYYYLSDAIGSTSVISSGDGKVIEWDADYFPYGGEQVFTSKVTNYYQFTGYEKDFETGYHYAVNRLQSPTLGRFFSPDRIPGTIGNPQSWNRYAYVSNQPTGAIDPLGLDQAAFCAAEFESCDGGIGTLDGGAWGSGGGGGGGGGGQWDGSQSAAQEVWGQGLHNYLWQVATGGYLPSECHTSPYDPSGDVWCGSGDSETGDWVDVGQVNISQSSSPGLPPNLPLGTAQKYWEPFTQGFNEAKKRLKSSTCSAFYGGHGLATLQATQYRFLDLGKTAGASTNPGFSVFLNSNPGGPYMNPPASFLGVSGIKQLRAFMILHELGHELSGTTGFIPDAGQIRLKINLQQSQQVVNNCF